MSPCLNDATCIQDAVDLTKFTCTCYDRYTGDRCETRRFRIFIKHYKYASFSVLPPTTAVNCSTVLNDVQFKQNTTAAPLSCFQVIATNTSAYAALAECNSRRTNVTTQSARLAWITNIRVNQMLRAMIPAVSFVSIYLISSLFSH
jgi:hypothetical protein